MGLLAKIWQRIANFGPWKRKTAWAEPLKGCVHVVIMKRMEGYKIRKAEQADAPVLARYIMMAMTDDCCQYLAGAGNNLDDFYRLMTKLSAMEASQYSYRNALVASDEDDNVIGVCVAYDGALLQTLRELFLNNLRTDLGHDFSFNDDETEPGEYYIDSLAVSPEHRHQGIATQLLRAAIQRATALGLPAALLVDVNNPNAERLYRSLGFQDMGPKTWGGHGMKHLVRPMDSKH